MSRTSWRYKQRPPRKFWPINRRERNFKKKAVAATVSYWVPRNGWNEPVWVFRFKKVEPLGDALYLKMLHIHHVLIKGRVIR